MRITYCVTLGLGLVAGVAPAGAQTTSLISGGAWSGLYWGGTVGVAATDLSRITDGPARLWAGHLGYGINIGALYFGAEVDSAWGGARRSFYVSPLYSSTTEVDWTATARGRVGLALGETLVYVTGGAAWSGQTVSVSTLGTQLSSSSQATLGTVIGTGIEVKLLPNIAVRLEAMHYNVSAPTLTSISQVPASIIGTPLHNAGDETVVRAGLSIRFN